MTKLKINLSGIIAIVALALIIFLQFEYDATMSKSGLQSDVSGIESFTPTMVKVIDFGFDPAVASYLWVGTMPEILDLLFNGHAEYFSDFNYLTSIDPKMSYPYAFSVLTLPIIPTSTYPSALGESFTIGEKGLTNADPDWRIPYYMAINYYLYAKDIKNAAKYFNIAAETPGVPDYAKSFALNFGVGEKERDVVLGIWETVYKSSNNPDTKARAAAYIERLEDLNGLEAAAKIYKAQYGQYPTSTEALVSSGIISAVPEDPFGFMFTINPSDGTAGVNTTQTAK